MKGKVATIENCGRTPFSKKVKGIVYLRGYLQVVNLRRESK
jgi:hypothetical protein